MLMIKLFCGAHNVRDTNRFQSPPVKKRVYLLGTFYVVLGIYNKTVHFIAIYLWPGII
jgi:hypothetical protein